MSACHLECDAGSEEVLAAKRESILNVIETLALLAPQSGGGGVRRCRFYFFYVAFDAAR